MEKVPGKGKMIIWQDRSLIYSGKKTILVQFWYIKCIRYYDRCWWHKTKETPWHRIITEIVVKGHREVREVTGRATLKAMAGSTRQAWGGRKTALGGPAHHAWWSLNTEAYNGVPKLNFPFDSQSLGTSVGRLGESTQGPVLIQTSQWPNNLRFKFYEL